VSELWTLVRLLPFFVANAMDSSGPDSRVLDPGGVRRFNIERGVLRLKEILDPGAVGAAAAISSGNCPLIAKHSEDCRAEAILPFEASARPYWQE